MKTKVLELLSRFDKIEEELADPKVLADREKYRLLSQEHSYLTELKEVYTAYQRVIEELTNNKELVKTEKDPEFISVIQEEISRLEIEEKQLEWKMETLLVPPDPNDDANIIMELRAAVGGDEAALFVGDCVRMYRLYADHMGWKYETISSASSEMGGFKEYVLVFSGKNVHRYLQYEAGVHRVQRVPATETQGRVHTSAITVAILMEPGEEQKIIIDERDLKVDTYRSSGAGGQHVNTTDSAVRLTHIPTGVVVYCQQERSQHKNKEKALRLLSAKITEEKKRKEREERANLRSSQVGSGDRSEKSRTYNFPQNRLTDHRISLSLYKLDKIMDGDLQEVSEALISYFHQMKLEEVSSS